MRIRTTARPADGIRRCGVRHTPEGHTWPEGQFTESEIALLEGDPDVIIQFLEDDDVDEQDSANGQPEDHARRTSARARRKGSHTSAGPSETGNVDDGKDASEVEDAGGDGK